MVIKSQILITVCLSSEDSVNVHSELLQGSVNVALHLSFADGAA